MYSHIYPETSILQVNQSQFHPIKKGCIFKERRWQCYLCLPLGQSQRVTAQVLHHHMAKLEQMSGRYIIIRSTHKNIFQVTAALWWDVRSQDSYHLRDIRVVIQSSRDSWFWPTLCDSFQSLHSLKNLKIKYLTAQMHCNLKVLNLSWSNYKKLTSYLTKFLFRFHFSSIDSNLNYQTLTLLLWRWMKNVLNMCSISLLI